MTQPAPPSGICTGERLKEFLRFCFVGSSGVVVDMVLLAILSHGATDPVRIALAKAGAAEGALLNNFLWNHVWTFRGRRAGEAGKAGFWHRLALFHLICGAGIGLAVALLHLFHIVWGFDLFLSNLMAIAIVTAWNYGLNARFNWGQKPG